MTKTRLPILLASTLALFLAQPAKATPTSEWTLISTEHVRYFLPGTTAPQNATAATGADATALAQPQSPDPKQWILVETKQISEFIPDAETNAQVIATRVERTSVDTNTVVDPPLAKEYDPSHTQTRVLSSTMSTPDSSGNVTISQRFQEVTVKPFKRKIQTHIDTATRTVTRETRRVDRTTRTESGQEIVITRTWDALVETRNPATGFTRNNPDPALDRYEVGADTDPPRVVTKSIRLSKASLDGKAAASGNTVRAFSSDRSGSKVQLGGTRAVAVQGSTKVTSSQGKAWVNGGQSGTTLRGNRN